MAQRPRPAAPPRPATCLPPAARARGFAFRPRRRRQRSAERRREGATVRDGRARPRSAAAARTMAPVALWAALAVGLQLWGAGHAVPVQVGDSRGPHAHRLARTPHPGRPGRALPRGAWLGATQAPPSAGETDAARAPGHPLEPPPPEAGVAHVRSATNSGPRGAARRPSARAGPGVWGLAGQPWADPVRAWIPAPTDTLACLPRREEGVSYWGSVPAADAGTLFRLPPPLGYGFPLFFFFF